MFDHFVMEALANLHQRERLEEAARERLCREARLAARMEAARAERMRRRAEMVSATTRAAPRMRDHGLRTALARTLYALARRLEGAERGLGDARLSAAR